MASQSEPIDRRIRRHDLVFVGATGWRALIESNHLTAEPLVALWSERGWPLITRRAVPGEATGVALGLPLPPFAGKRRLSLLVPPNDIVATAPPLALRSVSHVAPRPWWRTLDRLDKLASRHRIEARVFGSLAWHALTGLNYLTEQSDLDILIAFNGGTNLHRLAADIAKIDAAAPIRLDGELVRDDGAAVNWREFHSGARQILVKSASSIALLDTNHFFLGKVPS